MAGGEGTRLRPLTSNQPKPMVPVVGKPCMEHIVELLRRHGLTEIVVTVAFLPQVIRGYFGDGESLGVRLRYSVEETPLGTAGSVKNAEELLDETFLVISGDALCDFDLDALVRVHRERGAAATLALKSVENPLEFGVVIIDGEGRVERFLEKPSWGEVFSDTINTGVYVLEPEVLEAVPAGRPYDFSKELFPALLAAGRPVYGHVADGYWQDIGDLNQYRQANFDALAGRVRLDIPGIRLREGIYLGEGVELADLAQAEGPAYLGRFCQVDAGARIGPYSVLGNNVVVKEGASTERSVVDSGGYVGRSARIEGAVLGKGVDVHHHAVVHAGAAVGDECTIGAEAVLAPGIKVYPFKTIEAGAHVHRNLIWESRGLTTVFGKEGVTGIINVDITPDLAARLAVAYGTTLPRGAQVVTSRDAHPASRMLKRAIISGLVSTGVNVSDLRVAVPAVSRHEIRREDRAGGLHVRVSATDPEVVQIVMFEPSGVVASDATVKAIERLFARQEFRRVGHNAIGGLAYPSRAHETYVQDLLAAVDVDAVRRRGLRVVIDYGYSAASQVVPGLIGELGVEVVAANVAVRPPDPRPRADAHAATARLVCAVGADLGVVMDNAGERILLVDERGEPIDPATALLLFLRELSAGAADGVLLVPVTESRMVEEVVDGHARLERTRASESELLAAAARGDVLFAGASAGGYVFPAFLPAYDAVMSLAKVLEVVARAERPLSALVEGLPRGALVHHRAPCPWSAKGAAMRLLMEAVKGKDVDHIDGIRVHEDGGWVQVLLDPDEPIVHIFAEGATEAESERLHRRYRRLLDDIVAAQPADG